jgi:choline dehydrogenase-like flavoprotein
VSDYDVIVIGSGAGGGTLVHRLAPSGKRILLLERGDWLPREPQNWLAQDVFVDNRYVSPDTWYDADGKPFQPQVHYFVGGATKLYGAALYRLRAEDFGELQHHDGVSPAWPISYDELEPYYTEAEQLYQVHGARGEDPTEPPASASRGLPRAADPAALRRPRRRRPPSLPRPLRDHARRGQYGLQPLRALPGLRWLSLSRARQGRRRGTCREAGCRAPQRHPAEEREGGQARDQRVRHRGHGGRGRARRRDGEVPRRDRGRLVRGSQLGQAASAVGERPASERPRQRLRPARCSTSTARRTSSTTCTA